MPAPGEEPWRFAGCGKLKDHEKTSHQRKSPYRQFIRNWLEEEGIRDEVEERSAPPRLGHPTGGGDGTARRQPNGTGAAHENQPRGGAARARAGNPGLTFKTAQKATAALGLHLVVRLEKLGRRQEFGGIMRQPPAARFDFVSARSGHFVVFADGRNWLRRCGSPCRAISSPWFFPGLREGLGNREAVRVARAFGVDRLVMVTFGFHDRSRTARWQ